MDEPKDHVAREIEAATAEQLALEAERKRMANRAKFDVPVATMPLRPAPPLSDDFRETFKLPSSRSRDTPKSLYDPANTFIAHVSADQVKNFEQAACDMEKLANRLGGYIAPPLEIAEETPNCDFHALHQMTERSGRALGRFYAALNFINEAFKLA